MLLSAILGAAIGVVIGLWLLGAFDDEGRGQSVSRDPAGSVKGPPPSGGSRSLSSKGRQLKKKARAEGNYVETSIHLRSLARTLGDFFYQKHHEWMAVCFLNSSKRCEKIWFHKGDNRHSVTLGTLPQDLVATAKEEGYEYLVRAHNHPVSNKDKLHNPHRTWGVSDHQYNKEARLGFSDQDEASNRQLRRLCRDAGLGFADVLFVAGDYKVKGDRALTEQM